ncbi:MAG: glycosyltransferase [Bdellovibrionales bacterium]|nr:glycosyltransferase [Bdellovibrionales bacterium]
MRVLLIANSYPLYRGEDVVLSTLFLANFCEALVQEGAQVQVLVPAREGYAPRDRPGIAVKTFDWSGKAYGALSALPLTRPRGVRGALSLFRRGVAASLQAAEEFKPDVVLAAFALPSGYFAKKIFTRTKIPYGVWCLGSDIHTWAKLPFFKQLTQTVLRKSQRNYADGFGLAREVDVLSRQNTDFLASSIPLVLPPRLPRGDRPLNFFYAGRFEPVKGIDVLLAAWKLFVERGYGHQATLTLGGHGGSLQSVVQAYADDPLLRSSLRLAGWLNRDQLVAAYGLADIVVIPSRNESIPIVFSEAVQADCPLITTTAGDMGALVERYGLGAVVPVEDAPRLADAMVAAVQNGVRFRSEVERQDFIRLMDIRTSARKFLADFRV